MAFVLPLAHRIPRASPGRLRFFSTTHPVAHYQNRCRALPRRAPALWTLRAPRVPAGIIPAALRVADLARGNPLHAHRTKQSDIAGKRRRAPRPYRTVRLESSDVRTMGNGIRFVLHRRWREAKAG